LAAPFKVAEVLVRLEAAAVVTVGGDGVVNQSTDPYAVPEEFAAMAQK
jgi:hypothetical protein